MSNDNHEKWVHRHPPVWPGDLEEGDKAWLVTKENRPLLAERIEPRGAILAMQNRYLFKEEGPSCDSIVVGSEDPLYRTEAEALDVLEARLFSEAGELCAKYEVEIREITEAMKKVVEWREKVK